MQDERPGSRLRTISEIVAVVVLSFTTILTAWSAFQSAKWSGVQANSYAQASADRGESVRASNLAGQQTVVDATTFIAWTQAIATDNSELADFYFERLRAEFKPAVEAWIATSPLENPDAPPTPFGMPEYVLAAAIQSAELEASAEDLAAEARRANQRSDNYVALTVLFAGVLFFIGISTRLELIRARAALAGLAALGMLAGIGILVSFPVEV